jgi:hypothetical protein
MYYGDQKYHYSEITKLVILKYINTTLIYINGIKIAVVVSVMAITTALVTPLLMMLLQK